MNKSGWLAVVAAAVGLGLVPGAQANDRQRGAGAYGADGPLHRQMTEHGGFVEVGDRRSHRAHRGSRKHLGRPRSHFKRHHHLKRRFGADGNYSYRERRILRHSLHRFRHRVRPHHRYRYSYPYRGYHRYRRHGYGGYRYRYWYQGHDGVPAEGVLHGDPGVGGTFRIDGVMLHWRGATV